MSLALFLIFFPNSMYLEEYTLCWDFKTKSQFLTSRISHVAKSVLEVCVKCCGATVEEALCYQCCSFINDNVALLGQDKLHRASSFELAKDKRAHPVEKGENEIRSNMQFYICKYTKVT